MKYILRNDWIYSFPSKNRGRFLYRENCECSPRVDISGNNPEERKTSEVGVSFPEDEVVKSRRKEEKRKREENKAITDIEHALIEIIDVEIAHEIIECCKPKPELIKPYYECVVADPKLAAIIVTKPTQSNPTEIEALENNIHIVQERLASEELHKDNPVAQGLWKSFGEKHYRTYQEEIPKSVLDYLTNLSEKDKELLRPCFHGEGHGSYLGIRCFAKEENKTLVRALLLTSSETEKQPLIRSKGEDVELTKLLKFVDPNLAKKLIDLVNREILEKVCTYCNNNAELLTRYYECIQHDPTLQKVILSNSEDLKTDLDIIEARLRSEKTHKDNPLVQGLWQSFGDINFREYSGDIPAKVIAYINTLSPTEKEALSDCFKGPSHHESYLGIRCMGNKKDDIFMLLIPEKYTKQKSKEAFYKGILTDGSRIQDPNADSENISFEITNTQSIRDELLKISKLNNPEEKKDQLRILIQSIKDIGETLLKEDKTVVINGETIDIADGLVAQYLADWYKDPETHETLKSILLVQKEPNTFTFDSLGLAVLNKQITLEQLLANRNPPAQYIYILDNENYRPAALVQGESKKGYHYFDSEGKIGDPVQIKNGTQFKISSFNKDFSPVADKITDLNTQDIVEQASKNTSILGRVATRYQTMSAKQKSMLGEQDKDFYQQIVRQYQETQKHQSIKGNNSEQYQEGRSLALEQIGTPNPEPNEDGTYDVQLHGSKAMFYYNPETNEAIIKNRGEGGDLHFPMEDQSVAAIKLFSYLAAYGNSDAIDRTQVGEEDMDSRQLVNRMNDLFPVEGTEYFRPGQMKEIANTLFYMRGKSFFWLLNHISIQKGNTTERVVNNDENASALSRMEMNVNTIENNRFALWKFLENLGDRVINANSLQAHMQENNGQIVLERDGSLLKQKKEATAH